MGDARGPAQPVRLDAGVAGVGRRKSGGEPGGAGTPRGPRRREVRPGRRIGPRGLWDNGQVVLTYARPDGSPAGGHFPDNPNGSADDIAGVCDATGLVFGLMPHPERYVDPTQHPAWTRMKPLPAEGRGLAVFRGAVRHVGEALGAGV